MDQFRIRLCQFHNDHHEIQQDICTWNHQAYPKCHIYKIFTKNITAIIVGAYYNSKFRIECKNHENHDATQKWNQKWCWISRFDTIQLLHHQEFKPLIMWLRRKVQIRIKISSKKWNLRKKSNFLKIPIFWFGRYPGVWIADYVPNIGRHFDRGRRHCPDHTRLCLNRSINSISRNFSLKFSVPKFKKFSKFQKNEKTYSDRKVCQSIHLGKYKENHQLG